MTTMLLALRQLSRRAVTVARPRHSLLAVAAAAAATPRLRWMSDATVESAYAECEAATSVLPAHIKFRMPDLDFEQISGGTGGVTLSKWHLKEGAAIKDGTHMCEIDTPDLVFVLDSGDEGFLARILVPAETKDVPPGQPLAIIVPTEADIAPFVEALHRHPKAIEGYAEPTPIADTDAATDSATATVAGSASTATGDADGGDGAAVLRQLHKLDKDGRFANDKVLKVLKSLARKNDTQLLVTYKASHEGDAFDADFFVDSATELAEEALANAENNTSN